MSIKPARINITTKTKDLLSDFTRRLTEDEEDGDGIEDLISEITDEPITYETNGILSKSNGTIKIMYDESEIVGEDCNTVQMVFKEKEPGAVSMFRGGAVVTAFVFDSKYKRQVCIYNNKAVQFEVIICTDELTNTVTYEKGGKVSIRYYIEFRGVRSEYGTIDVKVTPVKSVGMR